MTQTNKTSPSKGTPNKTLDKVGKGIDKAIDVADKVVKTAKVAHTAFKIIRGLFNAPSWYSYQGKQAKLAINDQRPFDPVNLESIGNSTKSPGMGTTHIIHNNILFDEDVFESDGFELATQETFMKIREQLKSNLPYDYKRFKNFVKTTITLFAGAKAVERALGWYSVTRSDIPELHIGMTTVPNNAVEIGKLSARMITCLDDDHYATTLSTFEKLRNQLALIRMPAKLADYISWWVGGVFIDQSRNNPQIYINVLRSLPLYSTNASGDLVPQDKFDLATSDISVLLDIAQNIVDTQGTINADLAKFSDYINMRITLPEDYIPQAMEDSEFFNVLINSYQMRANEYPISNMINTEYIRMDILPNVDEAHSIGAAFALGHWAGIAVPFRITSQAFLLSNSAELRSLRNRITTANFDASQDTYVYMDEISNDAYIYIQVNGTEYFDSSIEFNNSGAPSVTIINVDRDIRLQSENTGSISEATIYPKSKIDVYISAKSPTWTLCKTLDGKYVNMTWTDTADSDKIFYGCSHPNTLDGTELQYTREQNFSFSKVEHRSSGLYRMEWSGDTTHILKLKVTDPNSINALKAMYLNGVLWFDDQIINNAILNQTFVSGSVSMQLYNTSVAALFCEQVDMHIPVVSRPSMTISTTVGTSKVKIYQPYTLYKECYVPVLVSKANIGTAIYNMLVGLFSNEVSKRKSNR